MERQRRFRYLLAIAGFLGAVALALAACGSDAGDESNPAPGSGDTVSVQEVDGRSVLVNSSGQALYTSDEETASGDVLCVSDGCLAFWEPLTIEGGAPTGDVSDGDLGMVTRPDGASQVTLDGIPLYTFTDDAAGEINRDGLADTFDGQTLTWRVVTTDGSTGGSEDDGGGIFDY